RQITLGQQVEGRLLPALAAEGGAVEGGGGRLLVEGDLGGGEGAQFHQFVLQALAQFFPPPGGDGQVRQPVEIGAHQLHRGQAAGQLGEGGAHFVVEGLGAVLAEVEVRQLAENLLDPLREFLAAVVRVAGKLTAVRHEYCPCLCRVIGRFRSHHRGRPWLCKAFPAGEVSGNSAGVTPQYICCPPLMERVDPVMKPASSATRKRTPRATSLAWPRRPTGIRSTIFFSTFSGTARTMSVST